MNRRDAILVLLVACIAASVDARLKPALQFDAMMRPGTHVATTAARR